jgi:site-specific DNA-methyltransferase (adenine-specific)
MTWDLRCGPWQDTLADVECDALIVDAPYSARTHGRHDSGPTVGGSYGRSTHGKQRSGTFICESTRHTYTRRAIEYDGWTPEDVRAFVASWAPRTRGWIVTITDHVLAPVWDAALSDAGRYVFAPLPWVARGSRIRLSGDGPSSWTCWIVVARPRDRAFQRWGTLPGAYIMTGDHHARRGANIVAGAKPPNLMRALIRDYTRPGDLVCDPCAGGGTTLLAAVQEGRRAIGSEMDPETHAKAVERLERKLAQSDLWAACERVKAAEQTDLL